jgi:hypothetical protein
VIERVSLTHRVRIYLSECGASDARAAKIGDDQSGRQTVFTSLLVIVIIAMLMTLIVVRVIIPTGVIRMLAAAMAAEQACQLVAAGL